VSGGAKKVPCGGCDCLSLEGMIGDGIRDVGPCCGCFCRVGCNDSNIIIIYVRLYYLSGGQRNIECVINFIIYMCLRPYLSEPRRQLILVLSFDRCGVPSRDVLLYILSGASLLVPSLSPIAWACC